MPPADAANDSGSSGHRCPSPNKIEAVLLSASPEPDIGSLLGSAENVRCKVLLGDEINSRDADNVARLRREMAQDPPDGFRSFEL